MILAQHEGGEFEPPKNVDELPATSGPNDVTPDNCAAENEDDLAHTSALPDPDCRGEDVPSDAGSAGFGEADADEEDPRGLQPCRKGYPPLAAQPCGEIPGGFTLLHFHISPASSRNKNDMYAAGCVNVLDGLPGHYGTHGASDGHITVDGRELSLRRKRCGRLLTFSF